MLGCPLDTFYPLVVPIALVLGYSIVSWTRALCSLTDGIELPQSGDRVCQLQKENGWVVFQEVKLKQASDPDLQTAIVQLLGCYYDKLQFNC